MNFIYLFVLAYPGYPRHSHRSQGRGWRAAPVRVGSALLRLPSRRAVFGCAAGSVLVVALPARSLRTLKRAGAAPVASALAEEVQTRPPRLRSGLSPAGPSGA